MTNYEILSNNGEWILSDLREYFNFDSEGFIEQINSMSRGDILEGWLTWQGIIGYTDDIITVIIALFQGDESGQNINTIDECDFDINLNGIY